MTNHNSEQIRVADAERGKTFANDGFGFTSDWMTKWREFFKPIGERGHEKPKTTSAKYFHCSSRNCYSLRLVHQTLFLCRWIWPWTPSLSAAKQDKGIFWTLLLRYSVRLLLWWLIYHVLPASNFLLFSLSFFRLPGFVVRLVRSPKQWKGWVITEKYLVCCQNDIFLFHMAKTL